MPTYDFLIFLIMITKYGGGDIVAWVGGEGWGSNKNSSNPDSAQLEKKSRSNLN